MPPPLQEWRPCPCLHCLSLGRVPAPAATIVVLPLPPSRPHWQRLTPTPAATARAVPLPHAAWLAGLEEERGNPLQRRAAELRELVVLTQSGSWTTLKILWECLAPRTGKSEKVVCDLPPTGAPQGWHNWWIEGAGLLQKGVGGLAAN